ncbi:MAG TPA: glycoside hydrolase family 38 C-terminal domain-containing protein [Anaerolineales bacterium]|jgi:alpha-mannosidase
MRTLHVISHTHWDREWYLTFQQFRLKLVHLVDNLLEILENDPGYRHFMLDGQTIVLDDYLQVRPEKEPVIREYVKSGRLVIGPWHILPDMFLVGPEAHIRNLLEGLRTARKFGPAMMIGYMPDSFGHIGQMPQILRGFGINNACLWRGLDEEPVEFWWQAPDGSKVLMSYLRDSYSNGAFLPGGGTFPTESMPLFAQALADCGQSLAEHSRSEHLLVMLGTDHMPPPPKTSANIAYSNRNLADTLVQHSTLPQYFAALEASLDGVQLPSVTGELRKSKRMHLLPGVLSTRMWIKQRNQASENLLTRWVEPFSTFATILALPEDSGQPVPQLRSTRGIIRQAWRLLMENHPHDSICGCSIDQVHAEMQSRFDQVDQIGEELTRQSLEALAGRIGAGPEVAAGRVIVFNAAPFSQCGLVSAEINLPPGNDGFALVDETGAEIAYETLGLGARELIKARMSPAEFRSSFNMVNEGRVTGLGVRAYTVRLAGSTVHLDVTLAEAEPDMPVWERAVRDIKTLLDDKNIISYQVRAHTPDSVRVLFAAREVPALGWRSYIVKAKNNEHAPIQLTPLAQAHLPLAGLAIRLPVGRALIERLQSKPDGGSANTIENEFFRVTVEATGTISIIDKRNGTIYHGMNRFVDGGDCGDEYNYSAPTTNPQFTARLKHASIQRSPVRATLTVELSLSTAASLSVERKSRSHARAEIPITTEISLVHAAARIEFHTRLENNARDHRLRVHFPTLFKADSSLHDGHFELVNRKIGIPAYNRADWIEDPRPEVPQRSFSMIRGAGDGLTLANRGLPEVEIIKTEAGTELALTLLRCVGWLSRDDLQTRRGHAGPGLETPGAQMPGHWEFDYALIPHGEEQTGFAVAQARAFETSLRAISTAAFIGGELPFSGSFLQVESTSTPENDGQGTFTVSAIKQAEEGHGWLVRGYNPGEKDLLVKLTPYKRFEQAALLNLAEEKMAELQVESSSGSVSLPVGSHEIVTIWFGPGPKA